MEVGLGGNAARKSGRKERQREGQVVKKENHRNHRSSDAMLLPMSSVTEGDRGWIAGVGLIQGEGSKLREGSSGDGRAWHGREGVGCSIIANAFFSVAGKLRRDWTVPWYLVAT